MIPQFDFDPRTRVLYGQGTLARLGELVRECGGTKVLLVSDQGLKEAGHEARAIESLDSAQLESIVYDDVHENPSSIDIESGVAFARDAKIDFIVGLGGGSSMDCAKGINFLLTNGGKMADYKGVGKATKPMLPLIAVPTTAGTGSEAQSFAVIADPETHMKMACGDKKAAARVAILDPDLTLTMPHSVRTATGIDAISHAVESYVTLKRGPISQLFSLQAWELLSSSFLQVLSNPQNVEANGEMLLGAHFAGAAIENSMLGATHALANPVSAHFGVTHGIAIGILLPHVVRYNGADTEIGLLYGRLAETVNLCEREDPEAPDALAGYLTMLVAKAEQPTTLEQCNVESSLLEQMAQEASLQWTAMNNPRNVDPDSLLELYRCAF